VPLDARTIVQRNTLFRGLAARILDEIVALSSRRTCAERAILFLRGDPGDSLYGVITGRVRISVSGSGGKEVFLNIMEPGDSFGEIALLDGEPRTATATAMTAAELLVIKREQFLALLGREPSLAQHLLQLLCKRARWTSELMEDSALLDLPARLAKRLLSLAALHGKQTPGGARLAISQEELAQFLGLSRQIVNQHLQTWRGQGWISLGRGSVTISNERALRNAARNTSIKL
jgi:CRP/FNR family transcriptional regulator, cyclic AMP receptor protein